jgi:GR25 family glycosyltransferase involved in LPS biosynthesis
MKTRKNRNKIDIIYWINLNRSKDRYNHMIDVLKDDTFSGIKKKRIEAVDGKRKDVKSYLKTQFHTIDFKEKPNIYCCLLSHLNTLLEFSKSNHTIALIFEDDVSLEYKQYWKNSLNDCIKHAPSDWEVLQLAIVADNLPPLLYTPHSDNYWCASAYLVNKKGVLHLLDNVYDGKFLLNDKNNKADSYIYKNMNTYTYKYPYFTYTAKDSTLHPKHIEKIHLPSKQRITKLLF